MWMMPMHLHVNQKSDYDDDESNTVSEASHMKQNLSHSQQVKNESNPVN